MTGCIGYGVFEPTNATFDTTFDRVLYVVVNVFPGTVGVGKVGVCLHPRIPRRPYNEGLCNEGVGDLPPRPGGRLAPLRTAARPKTRRGRLPKCGCAHPR